MKSNFYHVFLLSAFLSCSEENTSELIEVEEPKHVLELDCSINGKNTHIETVSGMRLRDWENNHNVGYYGNRSY